MLIWQVKGVPFSVLLIDTPGPQQTVIYRSELHPIVLHCFC